MAGRVFEYIWQVVFNGSPIACPSPEACYCDLYGVCGEGDWFNEWIAVHDNISHVRDDLMEWDKKKEYHREHCLPGALKDMPEHEGIEEGKVHAELRASVEMLEAERTRRTREAFDTGRKLRDL